MPSDISQIERDKYCTPLVESEKAKLVKREHRMVATGGCGVGK